jgi:transcriptional regulator with XRE-family HTH domain
VVYVVNAGLSWLRLKGRTMDSDASSPPSAKIDTTVPVSARIWNYWLGGKDYYPVDKEAGDQFAQIYPGIFDSARASRYFIARVVRYLAGEAGIRQFLDIGTGLPSHDNTHEIAQRVAPDSRVVYVDNDPLVLAHARALLTGNAEGSTDYIDADLNDPNALLRIAGEKLDFGRPVAIMLMGTLAHIGNPEEDDDRAVQSIVGTLKDALPSGGYLALYDSSDADPGLNDALRKYNESGAAPYRVRRPDQIARHFDGLELVDPGVVRIQQWRPDHTPFGPAKDLSNNMGGVGRKVLCPPPPGAIMDLPEIAGERDQVSGYEQAGPVAARMLLGARLRKLRESAGISREDAGYAIRGSESKISRMELGRTGLKLRDVSDLLDLYQVGEDERATLLVMTEHAGAPGWWQAFSGAIPAWFAPYLGLEQAAEVIRCYEVQFIPGLLQTPDYARAVLQIEAGDDPELDTDQQVSLRMRRQQILHRPSPPRLWAVIDEAALRRPIGGAPVARAQLEHLIEMARLSHVNIQVVPLCAGSRAVADGPITMLRFPEAELPDLVYLEQHASAVYLSKPAEQLCYWNVLNRLATEAPPPADTEAIIRQILREI